MTSIIKFSCWADDLHVNPLDVTFLKVQTIIPHENGGVDFLWIAILQESEIYIP